MMKSPLPFVVRMVGVAAVALYMVACAHSAEDSEARNDRGYPELGFEGEYSGQLLVGDECNGIDVGLQVTSSGNNRYEAVLYYGGLPGDRSSPATDDDIVELEGTYEDYRLELAGDIPLRLQFIHGRFTALDEKNSYRGHLDRVVWAHPDS